VLSGDVRDLSINLLASVVAGAAVWAGQYLLRYRTVSRRRAFFGLGPGRPGLLVVPRHASSSQRNSVHRRDVEALVELAATARECGATVDVVSPDDMAAGFGRLTEFCVGGALGNPRTAVHFRAVLPGVRQVPFAETGHEFALSVGDSVYRAEPGRTEYVLLARVCGREAARPLFIIAGQTSAANRAAARFLTSRCRRLLRRHGVSKSFCVILRIVESEAYGSDFVEIVADVTDQAFEPPVQQPA
jgi:hypothetical protein